MSSPEIDTLQILRLGEKIRTLRERRDWLQRDLAQTLGVWPSFIGAIERGEKMPNVLMLLKIATVFDVSADVLIRDDLMLDE